MSQRTILFVLLHFLGLVSSQVTTAHKVKYIFRFYPQEAVVELADKLDALDDFKSKRAECMEFNDLHCEEYWREFEKTLKPEYYEPVTDEELKNDTRRMCTELVYYDKIYAIFANVAFAALPKTKLVTLYKAAELKLLYMKMFNRYIGVEKVWDNFEIRMKSLVRSEKQEEVFRALLDATVSQVTSKKYDDFIKKIEEQ